MGITQWRFYHKGERLEGASRERFITKYKKIVNYNGLKNLINYGRIFKGRWIVIIHKK